MWGQDEVVISVRDRTVLRLITEVFPTARY